MTFNWDDFKSADHANMYAAFMREEFKDALVDLNDRLDAIEHSACIRRDRIVQAAMQNERGNYDDLQSKVVKLEEWLKACHRNWVKESSGHHQAEYTLDKMRELGLIEAGGQGGAAHPDPDPIPVEKRTTDEILADQRELYPGKTCACCWWYEKIVRDPDTKMPDDCSTFLILPERPGCRSWKHHEESP